MAVNSLEEIVALLQILKNKSSKPTKNQQDLCGEAVSYIQDLLEVGNDPVKTELEAKIKKTELELIKIKAEKYDAISTENRSYSQVCNSIPPPTKKIEKFVAIIDPKPECTEIVDAKQTLNILKYKIKEKNKPIRINKIKKTNKTRLIIECDHKKDRDNIIDALKYDKDIDAIIPKGLSPSIQVHGIDRDIDNEDIVNLIMDFNPNIKDVTTNEKDFKFLFEKVDKTNQSKFAIFQVSPTVFKEISKSFTIYLPFSICRVNEYFSIVQCFKCHKFGHKKSQCTGSPKCSNCASSNHLTKDCSEELNCPNCSTYNKFKMKYNNNTLDVKHSAYCKTCPMFLLKLDNLKKIINYY